MSGVKTTLRCIECGDKKNLLRERTFRCVCGGLFEVHHNFVPALTPTKTLKDIFRTRANMCGPTSKSPLYRSGVWRFHELIMPNLKPDQLVSLGEGIVPIVPAGSHLRQWVGGDIDIWMILEGSGPTGSFKDFGGSVMMSVAKAAGVSAVGCASTGDTSAMAAAYAAAAGLDCFVLLPEGKITPVQLMQPAAHAARVIEVPGDFDDCMRIMQELVTHHGAYPANSLNPARIEGHQATVFLTAQFFRWQLPEWFVVPVGNGSNSSSIGKGMRLLRDLGFVTRTSRILGCQTEAANPLARSWASAQDSDEKEGLKAWRRAYEPVQAGKTLATATQIGDPVSKEKVMREITMSNGVMQTVTEQALAEGMFACAKDGYLLCPQTGIALAGLRLAVQNGYVRSGESVMVVSTATGMKFAPVYQSKVQDSIERAPDANAGTVARILGL